MTEALKHKQTHKKLKHKLDKQTNHSYSGVHSIKTNYTIFLHIRSSLNL